VPDIPRTKSNKIVERRCGPSCTEPVKNLEALANPEALEHYGTARTGEIGQTQLSYPRYLSRNTVLTYFGV
jgi:hypothetical protein